MKRLDRRSGVTNTIFASTVAILIIIAGVGFGLYATSGATHSPSTEMTTSSTSNGLHQSVSTGTGTVGGSPTYAYEFRAQSGAMVSNAWLLTVPTGMHDYAVSMHAEGLEPNGTYILEGVLTSGSMQNVPISRESATMNTTSASEFQANSNGTGLFWVALGSDPAMTFENIQLLYLPHDMMQNAMVVATISFGMMGENSSTSAMTSGM